MEFVDFHTHTFFSPDSLTTPQALIQAARRRGLTRIAVTDHNTLRGALEAASLAPDLVILGEEIMTTEGEILAFFVQEEIPPGLSPEETIARLREQGAFISLSHPFDRWRKGHWPLAALQRLLPLVDAIEGFNARMMWPGGNRQARRFAEAHALLWTAGSDAHAAFEVGACGLMLPSFHDAASLRQALQQAGLRGGWSPPWVHLASRYAHWQKRRNARQLDRHGHS